jgi:[lysine-biosynthesis-protein LysW]--L-2-aminoadipate ligase
MRIAIVAHRASETNLGLAGAPPAGCRAFVIGPEEAAKVVFPGETVLGRLDVRQSLDGVEPGLFDLECMAAAGAVVLNDARALRGAHDKHATATALARAGLPHPGTALVEGGDGRPPVRFPLVLKPRFGSWGRDVGLCRDAAEYAAALRILRTRPWFRRTGLLAQELVPPLGHDLRVVVAAGAVVGAVRRVAARGEWRTNVARGARRVPTRAAPAACELALAAAAAIGADLVGIDLLPTGPGRYVVLEANGAVDFSAEYDLRENVFERAMDALVGRARERASEPVAA